VISNRRDYHHVNFGVSSPIQSAIQSLAASAVNESPTREMTWRCVRCWVSSPIQSPIQSLAASSAARDCIGDCIGDDTHYFYPIDKRISTGSPFLDFC
jgi:hypothetical protein